MMNQLDQSNKIRWARKVPRAKIWRLYQTDAHGIIDEPLIDDVGMSLYDRCQSILMVTQDQLYCPQCGTLIQLVPKQGRDSPALCPNTDCAWQTTPAQFHQSWRHQDLLAHNAKSAFETFVAQWQVTKPPRTKMVLIDQLIHAFHQSVKHGNLSRSVANNLIEGSYKEIILLLDKLASSGQSTPELAETRARWEVQVAESNDRRGLSLESQAPIKIRRATLADCAGIAKVQVDGYLTAYAHAFPQSWLDNLTYEEETEDWRTHLSTPNQVDTLYVAETTSGEIVGYAWSRPLSNNEDDYACELVALHVNQAQQRQGIGSRLILAVAHNFRGQGHRSLMLWTLADNPIRSFYERLGGQFIREKSETVEEKTMISVAYGWPDINRLIEALQSRKRLTATK